MSAGGGVELGRGRALRFFAVLACCILSGASALVPTDAVRVPYCGSWSYYHRPKGHQTSTDDILVAAVACRPSIIFGASDATPSLTGSRYLDLGCGIGSTLLCVAFNSRPAMSLGIEAQLISFELVSRTVHELEPGPAASGRVLHGDFGDAPLRPVDSEGPFV